MNKQRSFVKEIVFRYFPSHQVYGDKRDFDLIQKIIDSKIIDKKDPWQLQSLGIVFGDALSDYIDCLSWWEVTDEYGTDPVLRYKLTTLQITAQTMISKRVGDEEEIDVLHIANRLKDFIINKANEYK